jgi:predicted nucleotidyltransferase
MDALRAVTAPFKPAVVYLFGSAARDSLRSDSDIDLALLPTAPCEPHALYCAAQTLAANCKRDVDLVDLSRASGVLRAQVVGYGRPILVNDARRADEFAMYALSDYAYFNERRQVALAAFLAPYHAG